MVTIKNFSMPHNCYDCDLHNYHECDLTTESIEEDYCWNGDSREEHCPLREVEAIPKDQINKAIEIIEQYICDVETDTVKAQGMAQALDMFEQALGGLEEVLKMSSVTPQEPQTFKWCDTCKEYDQEKHCCHRWSKVIRDTVEEMKQEPILDKIRAEIDNALSDGMIHKKTVLGIIDKYKAESEDKG